MPNNYQPRAVSVHVFSLNLNSKQMLDRFCMIAPRDFIASIFCDKGNNMKITFYCRKQSREIKNRNIIKQMGFTIIGVVYDYEL